MLVFSQNNLRPRKVKPHPDVTTTKEGGRSSKSLAKNVQRNLIGVDERERERVWVRVTHTC